ncbi:MAG: DUF4080 domain-containing protein [bacterium]|nr:DUF4080 domain-containing protein [bacterium]
MKKILLTAINARYTHSNLALYYLKEYASGLEYDITILSFSINRKIDEIIEAIVREMTGQEPGVAAFSVYIWNAEIIKAIIPRIKKACAGIKIILGGPEVSYNASQWIADYGDIDFIITGPGEAGFRHILENNMESADKIISIPNPPFSEIPFPYGDRDFAELKNRYIYYEASRGCPFRCTYCLSSRSDQKPEFRDIDMVKQELLILLKQKPKLVKFVDRTFNTSKSFYREIWELLADNRLKDPAAATGFHFEIYPQLLEDADFEILEKCPPGLFQFEIGIQSACRETLQAIDRPANWGDIKPKIERLLKLKNIHIHVDLIAGLPYEDISRLEYSFNEIYALGAHHFQAGFLKVLPGTKMAEDAGKYKLRYGERATYEIISNKWLSPGEMERFKNMAWLVDSLYNAHIFERTLENLEELFPLPFRFYWELAECIEESQEEPGLIETLLAEKLRNRKWEAFGEIIIGFVREFKKELYFMDCLRWDWCCLGRSHRYPDFLKSGFTAETKKKGYNFFIQLSEKGIIQYNNLRFTQNDLKKSIFFQAQSELFRDRYLPHGEMMIFLPDKTKINILQE